MRQISYAEIERLIKTKSLQYYNFYNADIPVITYYATQYYLRHKHDIMENEQILRKFFLDIEVYAEDASDTADDFVKSAKHTVNAITTCADNEKVFKVFYLLLNNNFQTFGITQEPDFDLGALLANYNQTFKQQMVNEGYIDDSFSIEITIFNDESQLLLAFWQELHRIDPDIITGWNSDYFDIPYLYNRTANLFGPQNVNKLVSKFGKVTVKDKLISIPEFVIADLLYLYKPRDEGGLNLGKKQPQYTLDYIAETVLGLKKLEYKDKNVSLNELYLNDPVTFLLYNIIDTALVFQLDSKQKHVDLYNSIRRIMNTPFGSSIAGSSVTFDCYIYSQLTEEQKFIRYGINTEIGRTIEPDKISTYPLLKDKKGASQKPIKVAARTYSNLMTRYPGAFVKNPTAKIVNDGSLVIDLDAASLYPSMILQSNISFDSYRGRVIPPCTYKMLGLIEQCVGRQAYPNMLSTNIEKLVWNYVDRKDVDKKAQTANTIYYIVLKLFDLLHTSGLRIEQIYNPNTSFESITLRTVLIPLLDIINLIHPDNPGYNRFAYDYLFMDPTSDEFKYKYPNTYVIENAGESDTLIRKYNSEDAVAVIPHFSFTLAGTLFDKHEVKMGLFTNFLKKLGNLRKQYKNARQESSRGSYEYTLNDNRQASVKVIMNTTYGLYGLSSFRYSNHWLAQSITNNGEMTIKMAQYIADEHLSYKYGEK